MLVMKIRICVEGVMIVLKKAALLHMELVDYDRRI